MASVSWMSKYVIIARAVKCNDRIFPVSAQEVFTVKFLQPCYSKFSIIKFWENINKPARVRLQILLGSLMPGLAGCTIYSIHCLKQRCGFPKICAGQSFSHPPNESPLELVFKFPVRLN